MTRSARLVVVAILVTNAVQAGAWRWGRPQAHGAADRGRVEASERANARLKEELARTKEALAAAGSSMGELSSAAAAAYQERIAELEQAVRVANREAEEARGATGAQIQMVRTLAASRTAMVAAKEEFARRVKELEHVNEVLSRDLREARRRAEVGERAIAAAKTREGQLTARVEDLDQALQQQRAEMTRLERERRTLEAEGQATAKRLAAAQRGAEAEAAQLTRERDAARAEARTAATQQAAQQRDLERLRQELAHAQERIAGLVVNLDLQEQLVTQSRGGSEAPKEISGTP